MKRLLLTLTLAAGLQAETVFMSSNGKSFHRTAHCMALARAHNVLTADRAAAEAHALHECHICYRAVKANKEHEVKNNWAQTATKEAK